MKVLIGGRATGKTRELVKLSILNNVPIVVSKYYQRDYLKQYAKALDLEMPEPIVISDILAAKNLLVDEVYIDNADSFIQNLFYPTVTYITLNDEEDISWMTKKSEHYQLKSF